MPSDAQVLCQIANGIDFLHRKGLAHGQLNPNTILIAQSNPVRMKVSEFGLNRCIRSQTRNFQTRYDETSHPTCWMLPGSWSTTTEENGNEIITPKPTIHGDEFAAGCVFFYFLTKGSHPFGSLNTNATILENIKSHHIIKTDPVNLRGIPPSMTRFIGVKILICFVDCRIRFEAFCFPIHQGFNWKTTRRWNSTFAKCCRSISWCSST
jgi:serine/threonine protein kinase